VECKFVATNGSNTVAGSTDADNSFKVNVQVQLKERFSTDNLSMMKQMQLFSPMSRMSNKDVTTVDIHELCE